MADVRKGVDRRMTPDHATGPATLLTTMIETRRIKHCRQCGTAVAYRQPEDDNRERAVCGACTTIHYENPLNVVGTVPVWGDKVLLCKRNIEPRWGKWTLPAGFMELNETVAEGAARETVEESGAEFELEGLFSLVNVARVGQVHLFYRARLLSDRFNPGFETIEARLFAEDEIPWEEIAFRTVKETLEHYFADRRAGAFSIHAIDIN
jgi:ADP-ribose pyrophosphatase YjhB (NUDIX family)